MLRPHRLIQSSEGSSAWTCCGDPIPGPSGASHPLYWLKTSVSLPDIGGYAGNHPLPPANKLHGNPAKGSRGWGPHAPTSVGPGRRARCPPALVWSGLEI